jgi:DNA-binding NarL/FixJ family response regulator
MGNKYSLCMLSGEYSSIIKGISVHSEITIRVLKRHIHWEQTPSSLGDPLSKRGPFMEETPASTQTGIVICDSRRLECELLAKALCTLDPSMFFLYAADYENVCAMIKDGGVHAVLISQPTASGSALRLSRRLHQQWPNLPLILLSDTCSSETVVEAFKAGAKGVVYRDDSLTSLCECIHSVCNGDFWARKREIGLILAALAVPQNEPIRNALGHKLLTEREEQVTRLVVEGMSNREISHCLKLSENTVRNYLLRIYEKLGICNRVELVRYAHQQSKSVA